MITLASKRYTLLAYNNTLDSRYPLGFGPADLVEDFSTYSDTTDFRSDPRSIYNGVEEVLTNTYAAVELDAAVGWGALTKSMRTDFLDATAEGGSGTTGYCTNTGHAAYRALQFSASTTEVWVEIITKFSTDFSFGGSAGWGCSSSPEHKLYLFGVSGGTSRFGLQCTDGQWVFGYPGSETAYVSSAAPIPSTLFDNEWHTIRFHLKVSSATDVADGLAKMWVDGTLRANLIGLVINRTSINFMRVGETRNQGAATNMEWWHGQMQCWYQGNSPGWD